MDERTRAEQREKITAFVQDALSASGSHGFDHVMRVTRLCEFIGRHEQAEMDILVPAALLHDIARPREEKDGTSHEEEGAKIAGAFLFSIGYDPALIAPITEAVRTHRYRSANKPEDLEAKILADADKLDAMGATGIARTFMQAGERGGAMQDSLDHIHDKLLKLHDHLYTNTAREIGRQRHDLLVNYTRNLEYELSLPDSSPVGEMSHGR
jgi:uncharacterized protein